MESRPSACAWSTASRNVACENAFAGMPIFQPNKPAALVRMSWPFGSCGRAARDTPAPNITLRLAVRAGLGDMISVNAAAAVRAELKCRINFYTFRKEELSPGERVVLRQRKNVVALGAGFSRFKGKRLPGVF